LLARNVISSIYANKQLFSKWPYFKTKTNPRSIIKNKITEITSNLEQLLVIGQFFLNVDKAIVTYSFFPMKPSIYEDILETTLKLIRQFTGQLLLIAVKLFLK